MNKRPLTFAEIIHLNFGFLGIQFGWGLQMANMSGIYKFLGAETANLPILWLAAPVTGILIQPILGQLSDLTWVKNLGRRRPYILGGAVAATLALILMPNSASIWMAAILLWVLDGSVNAAMQPYRALVADVVPKSQYTKAYAIQTFLVGIGSSLATALPWAFLNIFHLTETTAAGEVPLAIKLSFYIGAAIFLLSNVWTTLKSKEYPPEDLDAWRAAKKARHMGAYQFCKNIVVDFVHMPKIMREIAWVQFFSWGGWFCLNTYFGLGVAQRLYNLPVDANAATNSVYSQTLEKGIALGGLLFSMYTIVSFIYALFLPAIANKISRKGAHILSMLLGAAGLVAANFTSDFVGLLFCMIGIGCAWASIITMPYAMLAGSLPKDKMGLYMGLFNITITVPQIIASATLGFAVAYFFHNHAMSVIALGGVLYAIAALFTCFVHEEEQAGEAGQKIDA